MGKAIKWILSQITTAWVRFKWPAILSLASGVIMSIITFFRDIDIAYSIPIVIFVIGAISWSILGCIKVYEFITNKNLEIIYDNGIYNERKDITTSNREIYENAVIYRVGILNITKKTIESVSVIVQGEIEIVKNSQKAYWAKTKQYKCDINPGEMEFANLFASNDGLEKEITITVTGKDIPKIVKKIVL